MSAPTPDFLPGSRPPVTPCEKAADAVWRFETYDGASLVTSRDCDGVARAALTAALGNVEETARVLDPLAPWWLPIDHPEALHCRVALAQAEALHAWLLGVPETKEAG